MRAVIAAALLLLAPTLAGADALAQYRPGGCLPIENVLALSKGVRLNQAQTARVLDWHNRQPPVTEDKFDVIVIGRQDGHIVIYVGNDGMVCGAATVPPQLVDGLMDAIAGGSGT